MFFILHSWFSHSVFVFNQFNECFWCQNWQFADLDSSSTGQISFTNDMKWNRCKTFECLNLLWIFFSFLAFADIYFHYRCWSEGVHYLNYQSNVSRRRLYVRLSMSAINECIRVAHDRLCVDRFRRQVIKWIIASANNRFAHVSNRMNAFCLVSVASLISCLLFRRIVSFAYSPLQKRRKNNIGLLATPQIQIIISKNSLRNLYFRHKTNERDTRKNDMSKWRIVFFGWIELYLFEKRKSREFSCLQAKLLCF